MPYFLYSWDATIINLNPKILLIFVFRDDKEPYN